MRNKVILLKTLLCPFQKDVIHIKWVNIYRRNMVIFKFCGLQNSLLEAKKKLGAIL